MTPKYRKTRSLQCADLLTEQLHHGQLLFGAYTRGAYGCWRYTHHTCMRAHPIVTHKRNRCGLVSHTMAEEPRHRCVTRTRWIGRLVPEYLFVCVSEIKLIAQSSSSSSSEPMSNSVASACQAASMLDDCTAVYCFQTSHSCKYTCHLTLKRPFKMSSISSACSLSSAGSSLEAGAISSACGLSSAGSPLEAGALRARRRVLGCDMMQPMLLGVCVLRALHARCSCKGMRVLRC